MLKHSPYKVFCYAFQSEVPLTKGFPFPISVPAPYSDPSRSIKTRRLTPSCVLSRRCAAASTPRPSTLAARRRVSPSKRRATTTTSKPSTTCFAARAAPLSDRCAAQAKAVGGVPVLPAERPWDLMYSTVPRCSHVVQHLDHWVPLGASKSWNTDYCTTSVIQHPGDLKVTAPPSRLTTRARVTAQTSPRRPTTTAVPAPGVLRPTQHAAPNAIPK